MKVLSKYVVREVVPPMLVSLSIFTFVFLMRTIADLAEKLIEHNYTLAETGLLLLYSIPAIMGYVIPMSLLLGIIVGLNRMSGDSEVIAITSSGISSHSFLFPLLGISIIAWIVNMWLLAIAVPWSNQEYGNIILQHSAEVVSAEVKPRIFNEDFTGFIIYINDVESSDSRKWEDVFIFDNSDIDYPKAILAKEAELIPRRGEKTIDLLVRSPYSYTFPREDLENPTPVSSALTDTFHLVEEEGLDDRLASAKDNRAKTIPELLDDIDRDENRMIFLADVRNESERNRRLDITMEVASEPVSESIVEIPPTGRGSVQLEMSMHLSPGYERKPLGLTISHRGETVIEQDFTISDFEQRRYSYSISPRADLGGAVELLNSKLLRQKTNAYWIELHKKFALPFTCIVFSMLGMSLGLSSRRGGKAYGYVVGITIFIVYWGLLSTGERFALYERVSPALGIWAPNIIFGVLAILLFLRRHAELRLPGLSNFLLRIKTPEEKVEEEVSGGESKKAVRKPVRRLRPLEGQVGRIVGFPQIVDRYVIRTFITMFVLSFLTVYAVFSIVQFIDVNNDIQKNNVDPNILVDFFQFTAPETARWVIPISALMGTMIAFGILSKNAEIMAFKSSGLSLYRISVPVIVMALVISMISFYNNDFIIPATAPRLAEIKGVIRNRPVQTTRDPRNRWVLGDEKNRIYYFQLYSEERRELDGLHLFEIEPESFVLKQHIFTNRAEWSEGSWLAETGWITAFDGIKRTPTEITSPETLPMTESPDYFGQEIKPSDQMSYAELADYIETLENYGFPTIREKFDLHWKLSFPFLPLVMTFLGLPFAFRTARKAGALSGVFVSISFVVFYWGMMSLFRALGQTGLLPAILAAWSPNVVFLGVGALLFAALRS